MSITSLEVMMNAIIVVQTVTSAVMCVYGYKWSKGLIATMSIYIGVFIGGLITAMLINIAAHPAMLLALPVTVIWFWVAAYKVVWLNHFLAGFLLVMKLSYMIVYTMMDNGIIEFNLGALLGMPLVLGLISGIIICAIFNNYVVLLCVTFIGATELGTRICAWIDKGLFVTTGNIGFMFNPLDIVLEFFGIETLGLKEVAIIIIIFVVSFLVQRGIMISNGIDLSGTTLDDRN